MPRPTLPPSARPASIRVLAESSIKRGLVAVAAFGLACLVLGLASNLIHASTEGESLTRALIGEVRDVLHPDHELTVWSWYSSLLLAGLALVFAAIAFTVKAAGGRSGAYVVLAVVALVMSADEAAAFHEKLNVAAGALNVAVPWTYPWVFLGGITVLIVGAVLLWVGRDVDPRLRTRLITGGAIFLAGALGTEILGGAVANSGERFTDPGVRLLYHVTLFFEEGMEALGALIALWAALELLVRGVTSRRRSGKAPGTAESAV